jgi:hypothetical protein
VETTYNAEKMREAVEVAGLFYVSAAHDRWKPEDLAFRITVARYKSRKTFDNLLEHRRPSIYAGGVHRTEQGSNR